MLNHVGIPDILRNGVFIAPTSVLQRNIGQVSDRKNMETIEELSKKIDALETRVKELEKK